LYVIIGTYYNAIDTSIDTSLDTSIDTSLDTFMRIKHEVP